MTKLIPTDERIARARGLIEIARTLPKPDDRGWLDFSYAAQVKDVLRQAKDLIKFVPMISGATAEQKQQAKEVIGEIIIAEKEILHRAL